MRKAVVAALILGFAWADEPRWLGSDVLRRRVRRSVEAALAYLARTQQPDGSWKDIIGRKVCDLYVGHYDKHIGVTALACMAFLAHGDLPGRGRYGKVVERGLDFILKHVDENGYISYSNSRMYSHAFATLFLAEVYGMVRRDDLKEKLIKAVRAIERAQNRYGGWRYLPTSTDADISVTVCQIMALRAAHNAGIFVNKNVVDKAIEYVRKSATPTGGFRYQIYDSEGRRIFGRVSFALTAAGVVALQGAGKYDCDEVRRGLAYLRNQFLINHFPPPHHMRTTFEYFYAHYYAIQAVYVAGGRLWRQWWKRIANELINGQYEDGRWQDVVGPNYATAMAALILQIPNGYLPIFQR